MSLEQIGGLAIALMLMGIGVVGSVVPGLPGSPVILGAALLHKLVFGQASASWWVLLALAGIAAVASGLEWLATIYGARKLGATWKGMLGAVAGSLVGLFFGPLGFLLGPFAGAVLLEMRGNRTLGESGRAGLGAALGIVIGGAGKLACCVAMVGLFALDVIRRSVGAG